MATTQYFLPLLLMVVVVVLALLVQVNLVVLVVVAGGTKLQVQVPQDKALLVIESLEH
jgi:hypothetical protein